MKKVIFTLFCMMVAVITHAATYYWVGGSAGSWTSSSSWATVSGGAGGARSAVDPSDILIFDSNSGVVTGPLQPATNETISQLNVTGTADVSLGRGASGTSYLLVTGSVSIANTASLRITGTAGVMALVLTSTSNSTIQGSLYVTGTTANRISVAPTTGVIGTTYLTFASGSNFIAGSTASAFSTTTTSTNPSTDRTVVFQSGSNFIFRGGATPYGASATSIMQLLPGANCIFEAANATNMFNRYMGNIIVRNGAVVNADGNPILVENITVTGNSTLYIRYQGQTPVTGSITVDAGSTFGASNSPNPISTSHLEMIGTGAVQTIGGAGTFTDLGTISIGTDANVLLQKNLVLSGTTTGSVSGKLNIGTNTISGVGPFQFRTPITPAPTSSATYTAGTYTVTLPASQFASGINLANVAVGYLVTGVGIPANTYIVNTSTASSSITLSQPVTATFASLSGSVTISGTNGTLQTANTAGANGSIAVTVGRTFGSGTNYIYDAATTAPFGTNLVAGVAADPGNFGNVTFNAAATTNSDASINGVLTLNSGKLTIRDIDTLSIGATGSIAGASATNYIVTTKGASSVGVLMKGGFTTATTFPVGSATRYMPVTLTPIVTSSFAVSVFEGVTAEGTVNGTPFTTGQKAEIVDAIWNINRPVGDVTTDPVTVNVNWTADLEGSNFTTLSNAQIGVSRHDGTIWTVATGSGNNTTNSATSIFTSFSPFGVGRLGATLPISFKNITASYNNNNVNVAWQMATDDNMNNYVIERADNSLSFSQVGQVASRNAIGSATYSFIDMQPLSGNNYYRIKAVSKNGEVKYSSVVRVSISGKGGFAVLQNPVKNGKLQVSLNNLETGKYSISLVNANGQSVLAEQFAYAGGSLSKTISLPNAAKGVYNVILRNNTEVRSVRVVVE